jgi:L-lactate utilization protein LutC
VNRADFLGRVRAALGRAAGDAVAPPPTVARAELVAPSVAGVAGEALVAHFAARAAATGMRVQRVADEAEAVAWAADLLRARGASAVADDSAVARAVVAAAALPDPEPGGAGDAAHADVGVTRAWRAVAETGTVVLRSEQGRKAALLPPVQLVLVAAADVRPGLTELYADAVADGGPPAALVQISGPSRTADIEMTLVTGVHGPGDVHVLLLGRGAGGQAAGERP